MTDFIPKTTSPKLAGLGPKAQRLQALRDKAARQQPGAAKADTTGADAAMKARNSFSGKKTAFQRKAT